MNLSDSKFPTFLHVGCGPKNKEATPFADKEWNELRLDIDARVYPDVVGSMTNMELMQRDSVDAVFTAHNIEHLYPHEVPIALSEFKRVLKASGFVLLVCPDLLPVCKAVAMDKLTDTLYQSSMGPITPLDIIFGHRLSMQAGNLYMAHRCGFTKSVLAATLRDSGFTSLVRSYPNRYELWAVAIIGDQGSNDVLFNLANRFFP